LFCRLTEAVGAWFNAFDVAARSSEWSTPEMLSDIDAVHQEVARIFIQSIRHHSYPEISNSSSAIDVAEARRIPTTSGEINGRLEERIISSGPLHERSKDVGSPNREYEDVNLLPFEKGGGHHVPAKSAFFRAKNYDSRKVLTIPNHELLRHGIDHALVTGAQQTLYRALARKSSRLTWKDAEDIEIRALVHGGLDERRARAVVRTAIRHLRNLGVRNPTRIPWGD
jgi:hypothetical protein